MNKRICSKCGRIVADYKELDLHHIIPKGMGGKDTIDNLEALCRNCHTKRELENNGIFEKIKAIKEVDSNKGGL